MLEVDGNPVEGVWLNCKVCGKGFEVKAYDKDWRKLCGDPGCARKDSANRMRAYRATPAGKAAVKKANLAYKRPEREWGCVRCGGKILSTRKRSYCDDCIEWGRNMGYKNPVSIFAMQKYRKNNPEKCSARVKVDGVLRRIKRGTLDQPPCDACGTKEDMHFHHHSYRVGKEKDVIPLCRTHHHELHSWDSN
jgi:hypothetical protein